MWRHKFEEFHGVFKVRGSLKIASRAKNRITTSVARQTGKKSGKPANMQQSFIQLFNINRPPSCITPGGIDSDNKTSVLTAYSYPKESSFNIPSENWKFHITILSASHQGRWFLIQMVCNRVMADNLNQHWRPTICCALCSLRQWFLLIWVLLI